TGRDVGEALSREPFQEHLHRLVTSNVNNLLTKDCGPLVEIIPQHFQSYFKIGVRTLKYRLRDGVVAFLGEDSSGKLISNSIQQQLDRLGDQEINELFSSTDRLGFYMVLDDLLNSLLAGPELEKWLAGYLKEQINSHAEDGKRLKDIIPDSLQELFLSLVLDRSPSILRQVATVLSEPKVREKIIHTIRKAIEEFLASLGPLAAMASFLDMDMVEGKIRDYLEEKDDSIIEWLQSPGIQEKLAETLCRQVEKFMETELGLLLAKIDQEKFTVIIDQVAEQSLGVLRSPGVVKGLSAMLRESLEHSIEHGSKKTSIALNELLPHDFGFAIKEKFTIRFIEILRSPQTNRILTKVINSMIDSFLAKPLGVTNNLVPTGIKNSFIDNVFMSINKVLLHEVPGLLDSLNVRRIVTEKVDSLDLLKLERLLLSIMEEQFKYINLFGAILGCLIGLLNLLVMGVI
ncbi:MAG: DUF445 domain-containing protein, partial [Desulfobulbaceae bacterium]|nr:DUF445 domain-containing protein [Desulfobulbaceae bacterium]